MEPDRKRVSRSFGAVLLMALGTYGLTVTVDWRAAVAVFVMMWANNVSLYSRINDEFSKKPKT